MSFTVSVVVSSVSRLPVPLVRPDPGGRGAICFCASCIQSAIPEDWRHIYTIKVGPGPGKARCNRCQRSSAGIPMWSLSAGGALDSLIKRPGRKRRRRV